MKKRDTREKLLDAAGTVAARDGVANITLSAVAKESGMSKGGLLHHFSSKDKLIRAMVERCAENWRACYNEAYESAEPGPGRMTRGLLEHCLNCGDGWTDDLRYTTSAVFAALAQNPELIDPIRASYKELHTRLAEDGLPTGVAEAVVAALDGLWLNWVLGFSSVSREQIQNVCKALQTLLIQKGPQHV